MHSIKRIIIDAPAQRAVVALALEMNIEATNEWLSNCPELPIPDFR